jgi:hypothetical protein
MKSQYKKDFVRKMPVQTLLPTHTPPQTRASH